MPLQKWGEYSKTAVVLHTVPRCTQPVGVSGDYRLPEVSSSQEPDRSQGARQQMGTPEIVTTALSILLSPALGFCFALEVMILVGSSGGSPDKGLRRLPVSLPTGTVMAPGLPRSPVQRAQQGLGFQERLLPAK